MNISRKLRLLFVWFGTRPGLIGGGVVRLLETNKILRHHCDYYLITQRQTYQWFKKMGLEADVLQFVGGNWAWIATIPALFACLVSAILHHRKGRQVDIVYSSTHSFLHVLPSLLLKFKYKAKLVVYVTLSPFPRIRGRSLLENMLLWFDRVTSLLLVRIWGDRVITVNKADAQELVAFGFKKEKIFVTKYGVDQESIREIADVDRETDAVFLGRLAPAKGVLDILDAWARVVRSSQNAKLILIGPGWNEIIKEIQHKIRELGLVSHVKIAGSMYGQDKYKALKMSKLLVLPSYEDTWCIAISEAMACGCAIVAYDLPALQSVYGNSIFWARIGDKNDLSNKIIELLESEVTRMEYVQRSKEFASILDWKNVALDELRNIENIT